ncbi:hypothetical protein Nmel_008070 [Mimus melanotis]
MCFLFSWYPTFFYLGRRGQWVSMTLL